MKIYYSHKFYKKAARPGDQVQGLAREGRREVIDILEVKIIFWRLSQVPNQLL